MSDYGSETPSGPYGRPPHGKESLRADLKAYLDEELSLSRRIILRWHLARCPECREEITWLKRLGEDMRDLEKATPRPELRARILASLPPERLSPATGERAPRSSRASRLAAFSGAAVALALIGAFAFPRLIRSPKSSPLSNVAPPVSISPRQSAVRPPILPQRIATAPSSTAPAVPSPSPSLAGKGPGVRTAASKPSTAPRPDPFERNADLDDRDAPQFADAPTGATTDNMEVWKNAMDDELRRKAAQEQAERSIQMQAQKPSDIASNRTDRPANASPEISAGAVALKPGDIQEVTLTVANVETARKDLLNLAYVQSGVEAKTTAGATLGTAPDASGNPSSSDAAASRDRNAAKVVPGASPSNENSNYAAPLQLRNAQGASAPEVTLTLTVPEERVADLRLYMQRLGTVQEPSNKKRAPAQLTAGMRLAAPGGFASQSGPGGAPEKSQPASADRQDRARMPRTFTKMQKSALNRSETGPKPSAHPPAVHIVQIHIKLQQTKHPAP